MARTSIERRDVLPYQEDRKERISLNDEIAASDVGFINSDGEYEYEYTDPLLEEDADFLETPSPPDLSPEADGHDSNLAESMGDEDLESLSSELLELFDEDVQSHADMESIATKGMELLGLRVDERSEPFEGACGAAHPLLLQAIIRFQGKAYRELCPSEGPVKTKIFGGITPEKEQAAQRIRNHMNYQLMCEMSEFRPETDKMLMHLGFSGTAFKKIYYNSSVERPTSKFVRAEDFVTDYNTVDLESCDRYTHKMRLSYNELKMAQVSGLYRDIELDSSPTVEEISEAEDIEDEVIGLKKPSNYLAKGPYTLLEMHINLDLVGHEHESGILLPYTVTLDTDSGKILSIYRNWLEEDQLYTKKQYFVKYTLIPGFGFYGFGYVHLIGGLASTATAALRQLIDAGTLANLPGGFKATGIRVISDKPIQPGEWVDTNTPTGDLRNAFFPLPYKEPSQTLMALMEYVVGAAKELSDNTDAIMENYSNYGPVGTTMLLMENSSKMFSSVHMRLHAALEKELKLLADINKRTLSSESNPYESANLAYSITAEDYNLKGVQVVPVSDPNMPTEAHRIAKLSAVASMAQTAPQLHNMQAVFQELYMAMGIESPERFFAQEEEPYSGDPVSENMHAIKGHPLSIQPHQEDLAHILVHSAMVQNPLYQDNPLLKQIILSHINDHLAQNYKKGISQLTQNPNIMNVDAKPVSPEEDNQIALAAGAVTDQLTKLDTIKAQIMQGEDVDPYLELEKKNLEIEQMKATASAAVAREKNLINKIRILRQDENKDLDRALKDKMAHEKNLTTLSVAQINSRAKAVSNARPNPQT